MVKTRSTKYRKLSRRRTQKGAAYQIPIREPPDHFSVRYINAHGEISPEIFYVVPDKTYLLMPNVCGVSTHISQTFSDPLYLPFDEADTVFRQKFIANSRNASAAAAASTEDVRFASKYTVFVPGDIIPMQVFIFDPVIGYTTEIFRFGLVGVFSPAVFEKNPLVSLITKYKIADNVYKIPLNAVNMVMFEIMENIRIYLNKCDKDAKGKAVSSFFSLYKVILEKLCGQNIPIKNIMLDDPRFLYSFGVYKYDNLYNEYYKSRIGRKYNIEKIGKIPFKISSVIVRLLLPLISENMFNEELGAVLLQQFKESTDKKRISINTIIEKTRDPSVDTIFVINACRSLKEQKDKPLLDFRKNDSEVGAAGATVATTFATVPDKYTTIDLTKPSAKMIGKLDRMTIENISNPDAVINMTRINSLRRKKGLRPVIQNVLEYSELYDILKEIADLPEPGPEFAPMVASIRDLLSYLSGPPEKKVKATLNVAAEATVSRSVAAAMTAAEKAKELEKLKKKRRFITNKIRELKKLRTVSAAEKEEKLPLLSKELEELDAQIELMSGTAQTTS